MDQARGNEQPGTPWWYRMPKYPLCAVIGGGTAMAIYAWVSQPAVTAIAGGVGLAWAVAFVLGMAQAAYDERHPR